MHRLSDKLMHWQLIYDQEQLKQKYHTPEDWDPSGIQIHDLQIITVHFMSLRRLL